MSEVETQAWRVAAEFKLPGDLVKKCRFSISRSGSDSCKSGQKYWSSNHILKTKSWRAEAGFQIAHRLGSCTTGCWDQLFRREENSNYRLEIVRHDERAPFEIKVLVLGCGKVSSLRKLLSSKPL